MSGEVHAPPSDQAARDRVANALDTTMFVEAGAGSGKTKALVDRVLNLIDDGVDVTKIAAITFTERAAGELRDRVRRALRDSIDESKDAEQRELRRKALEDIDDAAIGTLHGFARRLLAEHPIEAGLPITFAVRDEVATGVSEKALWRKRADALFANEDIAEDLEIAQAAGVGLTQLRELGESLDGFWDRIDGELFGAPARIDFELCRDAVQDALEALCSHESDCEDVEDKLYLAIQSVKDYGIEIHRAADAAELCALWSTGKPTFKLGGTGRKDNWPDITAVRNAGLEVVEARDAALQALVENAVRRIVATLAIEVSAAAAERRAVGVLSFDDLLVLARRLVTENPGGAVRRELHERYTHILLDEFQDTDPLQVDLAIRLASDPSDDASPDHLAPMPGRLFMVGDPKQSIYGFRGADLALYLKTGRRLTTGTPAVGEPASLTTNFRSVGPIIDWVNETFANVIVEHEGSQPTYEALEAYRGDRGLAGPAVAQLGGEPHPYGTAIADVRRSEAVDLVAVIAECMGDRDGPQWQVEPEKAAPRLVRLEDIAILLPRRTALPIITEALDEAGVPYRTESSGLVYASTEVRALIATLRAIEDADDELSVVAALRSVLFGCGDDDLLRFRTAQGERCWNINADRSALDAADPVVEGLDCLKALARDRRWSSPAAILERVVRERRLLELGRVDSRPRDLWRRVRFVIDQARSWSASGGGALREYIEWAESQMDDTKLVNEAILPETDDDAVRILTIHASKGLEFPVVVCAGLSGVKPMGRRSAKIAVAGDRWDFAVKSNVESAGWDAHGATDSEQQLDEQKRLLYVACTRARDHLVVSTHHKLKKGGAPEEDAASTIAVASAEAEMHQVSAFELPTLSASSEESSVVSLPEYDEWSTRLEDALQSTTVPDAVAVTKTVRADASLEAPDPEVAAQPVARVARAFGGTALGSAVHGVLQLIDLDAADQIDGLSREQCSIEGIEGAEAEVAALAAHALATDVIKQAAASRHWPELYVCGELDGELREGVVDLLFEADDGLVIVDYKTDAVSGEDFAAASDSYRSQVAAYARLVEQVTGRAVTRGVLLHLGAAGATEVEVDLAN
ncbi:MAG: UvrD-helicase domain-containing protein [Thermoleophilaceae bacterium]|nr:UvrD-helicase domain-containing protein [Thermoleophilaceae bacterium]